MAERKEYPQKPELQPLNSASSCPTCLKGFILFTRPTNCQGCGKVFCKSCCNYWIYLPSEFGFHTAQNVCKECFVGLSALDHSQKFDVAGPEDGLPVILLHPSAVTRKFWQPYVDLLSEAGYRVYALDFPGHGSRMDERLSVHSGHAAISEVYNNHIAPKKCAIWGHELGGYLALSYGGVHPDHCVGIIASNACGGRDAKTSELKMAAQSLLYSVKWNSTLAEKPNELLTTNTVSKDYIFQNLLRTGSYYQAWDGVLESVNVKNYLELIRSFPGKIFFLNGALTDRSAEERFLGAAQEACMEVLNEANDWFIIDDKHKELVTDLVTKFLAKLKEKEDQPKPEGALEDAPDSVFIHKNNFSRDDQPDEEALPDIVLDKAPVRPEEPKAEPESEPEPELPSEPKSEPQVESQPEFHPDVEFEILSAPEPKAEPEPEPQAEPEIPSEPKSEPEPQVELQASESQEEVRGVHGEFDEVVLENTEPDSLGDELAEAQQSGDLEQL